MEYFNKALAVNPNYATAWYTKGSSLYNLGKYNEAIRCYYIASEINPKYAKAWYNRGDVLNSLGKYNEAIQSFDRAI